MKALKIIGIVLVVIIGIPLIVSFFLPSMVHVERSTSIDAPVGIVFAQVNNLQNWDNWSAWKEEDPNISVSYEGPEEGVGAVIKWESATEGNGSLVISESVENQSIKTDLDFMEKGTAKGTWTFEETESGTKVTWGMDADLGSNPIGKIFGLFMENMVAPDFEEGLANLAAFAVTVPVVVEPPPISVSMREIEPQAIMSIVDSSTVDMIVEKMGELFDELMELVKKENMTGAPFAIWHKWNPKGMCIWEAGIPVNEVVGETDRIKAGELPGGRVAMAVHYGAYLESEPAFKAIMGHIKEIGDSIGDPPWEVYVTGPSTEPDTSKWRTDIFFRSIKRGG